MLDPNDRILLFEALKPPEGYVLDHAIGTSFSLDLTALLSIPLAFTVFDVHGSEEAGTDDNFALLESLRRFTDKMTVFCQAGDIHIPFRNRLFFAYLENVVYAVSKSSKSGIFHPKIWLNRYSNADHDIKYRVICLSRNISFDPSWDTCLTLEGDLLDRKNAIAVNRPLSNFIQTLPRLAVRELPQERKQKIKQMQDEIQKVKFEPYGTTDDHRFWPIGIEGQKCWFFESMPVERLLIVSPFLSNRFLEKVRHCGNKRYLISNLDSLIKMNQKLLKNFAKVYYLANDVIQTNSDIDRSTPTEYPRDCVGLHAKLYILESGWNAHIFMGSANATDAAFVQNIEFMTEVVLKKSKFGINSLLKEARKGETTFKSLLLEYQPDNLNQTDAINETDIEKDLDINKRILARQNWIANIGPATASHLYNVRLYIGGSWPKIPSKYVIECWPITLQETRAVTITCNSKFAEFSQISFEALTGFFAFSLSVLVKKKKVVKYFVINAQMVGMPEDRKERILKSLISDRSKFVRFLLFLLAESGDEFLGQAEEYSGIAGGQIDGISTLRFDGQPLLESLLRSLSNNPEKLDEVAGLLIEIGKLDNSEEVLPEGFDQIWQPIWKAREKLKNAK